MFVSIGILKIGHDSVYIVLLQTFWMSQNSNNRRRTLQTKATREQDDLHEK